MGRGTYLGGSTKILMSKEGTRWESDSDQAKLEQGTFKLWDKKDVFEPDVSQLCLGKHERNFVSICAAAYRAMHDTELIRWPCPNYDEELVR
jgi:hypothetical protein